MEPKSVDYNLEFMFDCLDLVPGDSIFYNYQYWQFLGLHEKDQKPFALIANGEYLRNQVEIPAHTPIMKVLR